jgi:hypothetical protein
VHSCDFWRTAHEIDHDRHATPSRSIPPEVEQRHLDWIDGFRGVQSDRPVFSCVAVMAYSRPGLWLAAAWVDLDGTARNA